MIDPIDPRLTQGLTASERYDVHRLWRALSAGNPRPTRRDLLRWSTIAAGAVATANEGIVTAAPRRAPPPWAGRTGRARGRDHGPL